MCAEAPGPIIFAMTRSLKTSKVLLVADRRAEPSQGATGPLRRYRLARLRFDPPPAAGASRFEHLKRTYD